MTCSCVLLKIQSTRPVDLRPKGPCYTSSPPLLDMLWLWPPAAAAGCAGVDNLATDHQREMEQGRLRGPVVRSSGTTRYGKILEQPGQSVHVLLTS